MAGDVLGYLRFGVVLQIGSDASLAEGVATGSGWVETVVFSLGFDHTSDVQLILRQNVSACIQLESRRTAKKCCFTIDGGRSTSWDVAIRSSVPLRQEDYNRRGGCAFFVLSKTILPMNQSGCCSVSLL